MIRCQSYPPFLLNRKLGSGPVHRLKVVPVPGASDPTPGAAKCRRARDCPVDSLRSSTTSRAAQVWTRPCRRRASNVTDLRVDHCPRRDRHWDLARPATAPTTNTARIGDRHLHAAPACQRRTGGVIPAPAPGTLTVWPLLAAQHAPPVNAVAGRRPPHNAAELAGRSGDTSRKRETSGRLWRT